MYNENLVIPGNTGLQNEPRQHPKDFVLGATPTPKVLKTPDGHGHAEHAPTDDSQRLGDGDSNGCVSFAVNNTYEYDAEWWCRKNERINNWFQANGYIDGQGNIKFNNRIVVVGSDTDPDSGNTVTNVVEFVRKNGLSPQSAYPWDNSISVREFYKTLTDEVRESGKKLLNILRPVHEWLPKKSTFSNTHTPIQLIEGLKYGVLTVSVDGRYQQDSKGLVVPSNQYGHRVALREYKENEYWEIHDSYTRQIVKFAWDYPFGNAKLHYFFPVEISPTPEPNEVVAGQFAQFGKAIFIYGLEGKYEKVPLAFNDGDVLKALFGEYDTAKPRLQLNALPLNYKIIIIQ